MKGRYATLALALGIGFGCVAPGCGAAQSKAQLQLGAIYAGCKASLDVDRDAGAAGAIDDETNACRGTLHAWEKLP